MYTSIYAVEGIDDDDHVHPASFHEVESLHTFTSTLKGMQ